MAVTYKKKRFMYQYAKDVLKLPVPAMKDCIYDHDYEGIEWLAYKDSKSGKFTKLVFHCGGNIVFLREFLVNPNGDICLVRKEQLKSIYL